MSYKMETVASFDIGKKNFSFYVETFNLEDLPKDKCDKKYNIDGTPTEIMNLILDKVYKNGTIIELSNNDLTKNSNKNLYLDPIIYVNMYELLEKYNHIWDKCSTFIIEQQMSFGKQHNTMALKLGQHCASYFYFRYGMDKKIIEFPAYHKTTVLGSQKIKKTTKKGNVTYKNIDKPARKKWCIQKALEILETRNDNNTINIISKSKKKDDLSDVICQLQAYKTLLFT